MDNFQNTSLKRSRRQFESTALRSMNSITNTIKHSNLKNSTVKSTLAYSRMSLQQQSLKSQDNEKQAYNFKSKIQKLALKGLEDDARIKKEPGSKFMRHFYYQGINRFVKQPLLTVPNVVFELYDFEQRKRSKPSDPPVGFCQGYIPSIKHLFYAVQNKIVFISATDLQNPNFAQIGAYSIAEVRDQVFNIIEIKGSRQIAKGQSVMLAVHYSWEMQLFYWEPQLQSHGQNGQQKRRPVKNLKPLNIICKLPIQKADKALCDQNGNFYFFDQQGSLHQSFMFEENRIKILSNNKFKIRTYVNSSKNALEVINTRKGKFETLLNLSKYIGNLTKLLLPYSTQTQALVCDNKRQLLFGLLHKNIKIPFGSENQLYIICYQIKNKPVYVHSFSEQLLLKKYISHYASTQDISNFCIESISQAPQSYQNANLLIITKSCIRIFVEVTKGDVKIAQIIRPPDQQMFIDQYQRKMALDPLLTNPIQKNMYKLRSFYEDECISFSIASTQKSPIFSYVSMYNYQRRLDIRLSANLIELQIIKQGSWKVKTHRIQAQLINQKNLSVAENSEMSDQALNYPKVYLFQSDTKLQFVSYLRPIDILFTILHLKPTQVNSSINSKSTNLTTSKQKFIYNIFITENDRPSLVCNCWVSFEELCSMIFQIKIDKHGSYIYSSSAAAELCQIWESLNQSENIQGNANKMGNYSKWISEDHYKYRKNKKYLKIGQNHTYTYANIPEPIIHQAGTIYQNYVEELKRKRYENDRNSTMNTNKEQLVNYQCQIIQKYLSQILKPVWNRKISSIDKNLALICEQKVTNILQYLTSHQNKVSIYESDIQIKLNKKQRDQQLSIVSRVKQLLLIIQNVPLLPQNMSFVDCLSDGRQLQQCIFNSIHRQFKSSVIRKWKSLFPSFISTDFYKTIMLYGEIEEMHSKPDIIQAINSQTHLKIIPYYFSQYLFKVRRFSPQQIKQIKLRVQYNQKTELYHKMCKRQQFVIPPIFIQIAAKYENIQKIIDEFDLQVLLDILLDKTQDYKIELADKKSLLLFLKKNQIWHNRLEYVSKCLSVQYQIYMFYLKQLQKLKKKKGFIFWGVKQDKKVQENLQTVQLLKYNTVTDSEKLKKLIWVTADYWLMADYCTVFSSQQLPIILKSICEDYNGQKSNQFTSFKAYIQPYLLNIAIKSNYNRQVLAIVCQVIDSYLQSLISIRKKVQQWFQFSTASITDQLIWLPSLLVKMGYNPQQILSVQTQQMSQRFSKLVPLQSQTIYGLKFLMCYSLADRYPLCDAKQFVETANFHLNQLYKCKSVENKTLIGLKKMLSLLITKST